MQKYLEIIRRPMNTEKSRGLAEVGSCYSFEVALKANKYEIKDAVQRIFKVKVRDVRTMVQHGKTKRTRSIETKLPNWKKAFVVLAAGQKIDLFQTAK